MNLRPVVLVNKHCIKDKYESLFFEKLFLSILEIIGSFRCACPYWCLLASQSQQVSYSCKDNSYDMVHHIQSSLGIAQHIWFVSGQIWSSQGRRATPPPLWDRNHGMKIMESKKQKKNTGSKYGSHREEERPATMGSAAGEGRQGWQQLGTFGQVSQYIYKIQKMIKKSEIQKGLVGWWAWLLLHSQWLLLNSQGLLVLLGSMLPEKIINAYVTKNITSMYYIQILFHGFVMQKNLFPGWLGEDLVRHGERSSGLHGEQVDCPAPGFLSRTLIAKYWNNLTPSILAFDPITCTRDIKY